MGIPSGQLGIGNRGSREEPRVGLSLEVTRVWTRRLDVRPSTNSTLIKYHDPKYKIAKALRGANECLLRRWPSPPQAQPRPLLSIPEQLILLDLTY